MSFVKKLKDNGYRISKAREIICDILESSGHSHYSVDEIHIKTQTIDKTIDLTTVYRTLELLEEFLLKYYTLGVITHEEHKKLDQLKLKHKMPHDWDGISVFARYEKAGIMRADILV